MKALAPLIGASSALALVVSGCGGGSSAQHSKPASVASAPAPKPAKPRPVAVHLRIVSPRAGAHVAAQTLTVRVALTGAQAGGHQFRYLLDSSVNRLGSARMTFHGLAGGHHRLVVSLVSRPSVRAAVTFVSAAPAPAPAPVTTPTPTTPQVTTPTPPASTTPAPSPAPAPMPTPSSGIPQGPNAGDGDRDNHGGATDGDGNI